MKVWVVTGPIGAGKSTVSHLLASHGAGIVDADQLGHEVLKSSSVMESLKVEFGVECIQNDGVDRKFLGTLVFSDPQAMKRLNTLTHPALLDLIRCHLKKMADEGNHELAVLDAAVYFLWPPLEMVDMVISVVADEELRLQRLVNSRGLNASQVMDRILAQKNLEPFWKTADVIIDNSLDSESLNRAVDQLLLDHNL